ncbi:MAG TPA: hypothetical protein VJG32_06100 [Anaerolineae bacterium]|nr:hypothetical protein [Anaerolineae bacterium]
MSKGGLTALYQALNEPIGPHLDDETLAEIASAEAAGEDVDRRYAAHMRHIESCLTCAEAYADLMEMMSAAVSEMAEAAQKSDPVEVYVAQLLQATRSRVGDVSNLPSLIQAVAVALPARFTVSPVPGEETEAVVESAIRKATKTIATTPEVVTALREAIRDRLPDLSAYLVTFAQSLWGRAMEIKSEMTGAWQSLQLSPAPRAAVPMLSGQVAGAEWPLLSRRSDQPLPLTIEARATRSTELECWLAVRVDRLGLATAAGRTVQIAFGDQELAAVTDEQGVARFEPLPIAALSQLTVRVQV